jgi:integrase
MSKPRPPYLQKQITRHGRVVWYVRKRPNGRIRIRGDYGSPAFMSAYTLAVSGTLKSQKKSKAEVNIHNLEWLVDAYRRSASWKELSQSTRKQRENIFHHTLESAGALPFKSISRSDIRAGIDKRANTPAQANCFLKAMRGLFRWALDSELVEIDPTQSVKSIKLRGSGFHPWTEEEIEQFENTWPIGTRERLALAILLYTGLRRGDAARLALLWQIRFGLFSD